MKKLIYQIIMIYHNIKMVTKKIILLMHYQCKKYSKRLDEQDSLLTQEIVDQVCKTLKEARLSLYQ